MNINSETFAIVRIAQHRSRTERRRYEAPDWTKAKRTARERTSVSVRARARETEQCARERPSVSVRARETEQCARERPSVPARERDRECAGIST